jgi:trigger factor
MSIPNDIHQVSDVALQSAINQLLLEFSSEPVQVKDRAVADGDMVNISYVGSVDGVVFEGGSTGDEGADVIAGSANYIDDFLTQIIGYMPGETVNVEVTFPEVYSQNPDLQNKNAVFVTTINYIEETMQPDLTDEFIEKNLSAEYGWKTVDELKDGIRYDLKRTALEGYVWEYLVTSVKVSSIPDKVTDYFEKSMLNYYQSYAELYEMKLDEFLISYVGVSNKDELIANNKEENQRQAVYCLVCQAIAEDAGISVNEEDLIKYFGSDYALTEEQYGLPFLKQYALALKIIDYIIENAILE